MNSIDGLDVPNGTIRGLLARFTDIVYLIDQRIDVESGLRLRAQNALVFEIDIGLGNGCNTDPELFAEFAQRGRFVAGFEVSLLD
jgi:hypothetical protein